MKQDLLVREWKYIKENILVDITLDEYIDRTKDERYTKN
jgi:hypothetical protein